MVPLQLISSSARCAYMHVRTGRCGISSREAAGNGAAPLRLVAAEHTAPPQPRATQAGIAAAAVRIHWGLLYMTCPFPPSLPPSLPRLPEPQPQPQPQPHLQA